MKIDFNAFVKGKNFDGLRALNLSNEFPDPSMLRNTVAFKILRSAGVPAPRTSFARVYINNAFQGLYVLIEQIDKSFIADNFSGVKGDLIKAVAGSLVWLEGNEEAFRKSYEIKSKSDDKAWERFIEFAKKISTTPDSIFYDTISTIFDFDSYLTVFAADIVFNNWDSYFFGQNYYLYRDNCSGKYHFLPWDYNVSMNYDEENRNAFELFAAGENSYFFTLPLPKNVVGNEMLREKYLEKVCRINSYMSEDSLGEFIRQLHYLIEPELMRDAGKIFTMEQFDKTLEMKIGISEFDFDGLLYFIRTRHAQISRLLKAEGQNCSQVHSK
jgi:spore coat protein CotH